MQHNYDITMVSQRDLVLMRVENGWVIRTNEGGFGSGNTTPLRVAETPEALIQIIRTWAVRQIDDAKRKASEMPT